MLPVDAFREVQNEATDKLGRHLLALQESMRDANKLHREQLTILQQIVQSGSAKICKPEVQMPHIAPSAPLGDIGLPSCELSSAENVLSCVKLDVSEIAADVRRDVAPREKVGGGSISQDKVNENDAPRRIPSNLSDAGCARSSLEDNLPMKVTRGRFLTWGTGFTGIRQILGYDIDPLVAYGAIPLTFMWGSIFRLRYSLIGQLIAQPIFIFFIAASANIFRGGYVLAGNERFADTIYGKPVHFINEALQRLVPFLLGLYISLQLRRWWVIRSVYLENVHINSMLLSTKMGLVFPDTFKGIRSQIERYCLAAHKMIFICARQELHANLNYDSLLAGGILTAEELQRINAYIAHAPEDLQRQIGGYDMTVAGIPLTWAAHLIYRIFMLNNTSHKIDFPINMMVQMLQHCVDTKKNILNIEMMLITPLPFPYVHLVTLVVHACVFFSCIECGVFFGSSSAEWTHFVAHVIGVVMLNGLYLGLLAVTALLTNPFTEECVHFPAANYHCRMLKSQFFASQLHMEDMDKEIADEIGTFAKKKHRKLKGNSHDDSEDEEGDDGGDDGDDCQV